MTVEEEPHTVDEQTPLIDSSASSTTLKDEDEDRPLPMLQILLLCWTALGEGVAFVYIFPFINAQLQETLGIPESDVGFYSGLIESLYACTQTAVMIFWGRISDRYGRKPVLVVCSAGICVSLCMFGTSTKMWHMVVFRSMAGVFAGSFVTVRTMISENSTRRTQAHAFGLFQFAGNVGLSVGAMLGGALSKPAEQYPGIFGGSELLIKYPYLLPCLVSAAIPGTSCLLTFFFVKETRPATKPGADPVEVPSMRSILATPGVKTVIVIFQLGWFIGNAYTVTLPIFLYTPVNIGGLGLNPTPISIWMVLTGMCQALWLLLLFAPLQHRIGTGNLMRMCGVLREFVLVAFPILNILMRTGNTWAFWVLSPFCIIGATCVTMIYTGVQLALNDISPSPLALGTLNGIAMSVTFGLRAFVPATFGSLFAVGVKYQILGGYLVWVILIILGLVFLFTLQYLPEKAEGRRHRATVLAE